MALFPAFRSKERDIQTDVARIVPILNATEKALRNAEDELAGLRGRLAGARDKAAFMFGDGIESNATGDATLDDGLKRAEALLVRGEVREKYLERQLADLDQCKRLLASLCRLPAPA